MKKKTGKKTGKQSAKSARPPRRAGQEDRDSVYQRIYATVDAIPRGQVATYGQIATEAGLPRRARLVGRALGTLPAGSDLPWYRVLNARGEISPRPGGSMQRQKKLLRAEGVRFNPNGRVDLDAHRWQP
jgi:methylated-DNA-protein-cysteine methyltransferase-like protein